MSKPPRLAYSVMTRRVYLVTRYKDNGNGHIVAHAKQDITEQFNDVCRQRMLNGERYGWSGPPVEEVEHEWPIKHKPDCTGA